MMPRIFRFAPALLALVGSTVALAQSPAPAPKAAPAKAEAPRVLWTDKLQYPALRPIDQPEIVRETLPNGLQVLLIKDSELPKVEFRMVVRGGRLAENKVGVSDIYGDVLRNGGAGKLNGDQVDEALEAIGANVGSGADVDSVMLYGDMLAEHTDRVFGIFRDMLFEPVFAQDKIDLAKTQLKSGISRRNDNVQEIAGREFSKLLYGADSPFARQLEYAHVDGVTREDLVSYHRRMIRPDQAILAVWGDFEPAAMKQRLASLLGGWKAEGPAPQYKLPNVPDLAGSINYVEKADVQQAFLLMGLKGLRFDDPDYPAIQVMSEILGGGFSSRLFVTIRTLKGLAYGAGGRMIPAYDHPGQFYFTTSTKPESLSEAMGAMVEELEKIRNEKVSDSELRRAKEGYLNTYVFDFDSKAKIASRQLRYAFYGYPVDFNARVKAGVEKVTKEDVQRVAQKYLQPDKLTVLVVGNGPKFDKPLASVSKWGAVKTLDITIPEPKAEIPAATPETLAQGKALMAKAAQAKGNLGAVKDITTEGMFTQQTPMGPMELQAKAISTLDRSRVELTTPMGAILIVATMDGSWVKQGPQVIDLPGSAAAEMRQSLLTDFGALVLVRDAAAGKFEAQAIGATKFEGQDAEAVIVRVDGKPITLFLAADGKVLGLRRMQSGQEGPAEVTDVFGDYKVEGGVAVPTTTAASANGQPKGGSKITSIKVNTGVDAALFQKPATPAAK